MLGEPTDVKRADRRGARRNKTDEDIAERMTGGIRLDRSSAPPAPRETANEKPRAAPRDRRGPRQ